MTEGDKKQKSIQNSTLMVVVVTNFTTLFAITSLNIAVPQIGLEFHASATSLTWVVISFIFVVALLPIPFGKIADIYGRALIYKLGMLLFCISSFFNIFAANMPVFLLLRVLQGIGAALIFATSIAVLAEVFPANKRGSVIGLSSTAVFLGQACGPSIGGIITRFFGWRALFVIISALNLYSLITAIVRLPKSSGSKTISRPNPSNMFLHIVSLGLFLFGLVTLSQRLWPVIIFAAGCVLLVIYVKYELRSDAPVIEMRLFSGNRVFGLSSLAALLNYAAIFAVSYLLSIYLQLVKGLGADLAGYIMISQPIVQTILAPIAGRLADRKQPATIACIGLACSAGALFMFSLLNEQAPIPYILAGTVLTGLGIGLFVSPNSAMIMGSVSKEDYGVAASVVSTARGIGQVIGMAMLTIITNATIGDVPIAEVSPALIVNNMHISFLIFSGICVAAIFISLKRRETILGQ